MNSGVRTTYLLPLKASSPPTDELTNYLRALSVCHEVIVVDASVPAIFDAAHRAWIGFARHIPVDERIRCVNGKVRGVLTGLPLVATDVVVIADDDVRFDDGALDACIARLNDAALVHPQNYYEPLPWHACWDTARIVLNRAVGQDMGGVSVVNMSVLRQIGGYDGDVLFENLELMRTILASGHRVAFADDVFVRRLPPTTRHFASQRVRQAYDEMARPTRLFFQLALGPLTTIGLRRRPSTVAIGMISAVLVAGVGRRRSSGVHRFPIAASLLAPLWLAERAACSWIAVTQRMLGGVPYHGTRVLRAASSARFLRARALASDRAPANS